MEPFSQREMKRTGRPAAAMAALHSSTSNPELANIAIE
jgi:hypothetical protein